MCCLLCMAAAGLKLGAKYCYWMCHWDFCLPEKFRPRKNSWDFFRPFQLWQGKGGTSPQKKSSTSCNRWDYYIQMKLRRAAFFCSIHGGEPLQKIHRFGQFPGAQSAKEFSDAYISSTCPWWVSCFFCLHLLLPTRMFEKQIIA